MKSPYDFANDISKLKFELDYDKYIDNIDDQAYRNDNGYNDNDVQAIKPSNSAPGVVTNSVTPVLPNISPSSLAPISGGQSSDKGPFGSIGGKGAGLSSSVGDIASFGLGQLNMFQNEAQSEKESWAGVGSSTLGGAALGMQVGGPIGAAIGGAAGLTTSVIDMIGDTKKRNIKERKEYNENLEEKARSREIDWNTAQGEQSIKSLTALRKSQLNYIDLDY